MIAEYRMQNIEFFGSRLCRLFAFGGLYEFLFLPVILVEMSCLTKYLFVILMLGVWGCSPLVRLEPVSGLKQPGEDGKSFSVMSSGVRMTVFPDAWTGYPQVKSLVTPLKILVQNNSGKSLRFRASDFTFRDSSGRSLYESLPLYSMRDGMGPPAGQGYTVVPVPSFRHEGFLVAPFYASAYVGFAPYEGPFDYAEDASRSIGYQGSAMRAPYEMYREGIPDGVLKDKGSLEGFIYFERIDPKRQKTLLLTVTLTDTGGNALASFEFPFRIANHR